MLIVYSKENLYYPILYNIKILLVVSKTTNVAFVWEFILIIYECFFKVGDIKGNL